MCSSHTCNRWWNQVPNPGFLPSRLSASTLHSAFLHSISCGMQDDFQAERGQTYVGQLKKVETNLGVCQKRKTILIYEEIQSQESESGLELLLCG